MRRKKILCLDQSMTCSGIVIVENTSMIHFECIKTSKHDGSEVVRMSILTTRIIELFEQHGCDEIVCEALSFGSIGNATRLLGGLLYTLEVKLLEKHGIDGIVKVAPTQLKKFATGSGKAKKQDMLAAVPDDIAEQFLAAGYLKSKGLYDLCDSYHIAMWRIEQLKDCVCREDHDINDFVENMKIIEKKC